MHCNKLRVKFSSSVSFSYQKSKIIYQRMLATHSIQLKPPSLEMSKPLKKRIPNTAMPNTRAVSEANLQESSGGIKQWWEKFSGRFKRLNRIDNVEENKLTSVNNLEYSELLPNSPVFTLGTYKFLLKFSFKFFYFVYPLIKIQKFIQQRYWFYNKIQLKCLKFLVT